MLVWGKMKFGVISDLMCPHSLIMVILYVIKTCLLIVSLPSALMNICCYSCVCIPLTDFFSVIERK